MKTSMKVFQNSEFGNVRVEVINKEPMFVLRDVCKALEIQNVSQCKDRLKEKGVSTTYTLTKGGMQQVTVINEANLYKCIFQSRTESAERFQDWVCEDVIPSIRKTGAYSISPKESKRRITSPATREAHMVMYEGVRAVSADWIVAEGYGSYRSISRWVKEQGTRRLRRASDKWTSLLEYDTLPRFVRSAMEMHPVQLEIHFDKPSRI
ncbi:MAG: BRO-N domain-containing protein [Bacteroidales bacterium]